MPSDAAPLNYGTSGTTLEDVERTVAAVQRGGSASLGVWRRDGIGGAWRRWHKDGREFACTCGRPECPGHVED